MDYLRNIKIINPESYLQGLADIKSGKSHISELANKDFESLQVNTFPLKGYLQPEGFPNCEGYKEIYNFATDKFNLFPNCCEAHKNLNNAEWFKKSNYDYMPIKLVSTVSYTIHCINKCSDSGNWFKEITDYIAYTNQSFGQLPNGFGFAIGFSEYLYLIRQYLNKKEDLSEAKKDKLIGFIDKCLIPVEFEVTLPELNILVGYYKDWLNIFPFEISFFSHLKPLLENQIPLFSPSSPQKNLYHDSIGATIFTKTELFKLLVELTTGLITEINTFTLNRDGLLTDSQAIAMNLLNENRSLELKEFNIKANDERKQYIKILKRWFASEKKYCAELTSLLKSKPEKVADEIKIPTKAECLQIQIQPFGFFDLDMIKTLSIEKQTKLIEIIGSGSMPYQIAMFNYLGFLDYLENNHFKSKYEMNEGLSKWFKSDKQGRAVKGNISVLNPKSSEDKVKYTAHLHKEKVIKDYQQLK